MKKKKKTTTTMTMTMTMMMMINFHPAHRFVVSFHRRARWSDTGTMIMLIWSVTVCTQ
jgi:hypothetical protein